VNFEILTENIATKPVFKAKLAVWLRFLVTRPQPKEKKYHKRWHPENEAENNGIIPPIRVDIYDKEVIYLTYKI